MPLPIRAAIAAFVVALVIAALVTPHLERFAKTRRIGDRPGGLQNLRDHSTPRIGGVAILIAFYASLAALILYDGALASIVDHHRGAVYSLMAAGIAIGALGFYDDVHGTGARLKFSVQTLAALVLYYYGYRIDELSLPGGATIDLGYLSLPLTLLWIVGVTNALNLVDGLDGLAGGVALFALVTNLVVAAVRPEPMMMLCMAALAGAVLGFLFYNFSPASIFMGDSGSLFLGLLLAATSLRTHQKSSAAVSLLVPIVALGLPIADTLLAMGRRAVNGRAMFIGDRDHIHHRLLRFGFTHRAAVLFLYGICLVLAAASLILAFSSSALIGLTLVLGAAVGWVLL
ncbi:MAG: glycosyltransferase family 4 protein, partial [Myxococcales bacterium]